eukprot:scpid5724/ scgid6099/ Receptor-type tyrosine-protein phosphatase delta
MAGRHGSRPSASRTCTVAPARMALLLLAFLLVSLAAPSVHGAVTISCWNVHTMRTVHSDQPCPYNTPKDEITGMLVFFEASYKFVVVSVNNGLYQLRSDLSYQNTLNLTKDAASCAGTFLCGSKVPILARDGTSDNLLYCVNGDGKPSCSLYDVQNWSPVTRSGYGVVDANLNKGLFSSTVGKYPLLGDTLSPLNIEQTYFNSGYGLMAAVLDGKYTSVIKYNPTVSPKAVLMSQSQLEAVVSPIQHTNVVATFAHGDKWYMIISTRSSFCDQTHSSSMDTYVSELCMGDTGQPVVGETAFNHFGHVLKAPLRCDFEDTYTYSTAVSAQTLAGTSSLSQPILYVMFTVPVAARTKNAASGVAICEYNIDGIQPGSVQAAFAPPMTVYNPQSRANSSFNGGQCKDKFSEVLTVIPEITQVDKTPVFFSGTDVYVAMAIANVRSLHGGIYLLIYTADENGYLTKIVKSKVSGAVVLERTLVFAPDTASKTSVQITSIKIGESTVTKDTLVYVQSERAVASIPVQHCADAKTCAACVAMRDPLCGWSLVAGICSSDDSSALQDLSGTTMPCPLGPINYTLNQPLAAETSRDSIMLTISGRSSEPATGYDKPRFDIYQNGTKIGTSPPGNYTYLVSSLDTYTPYSFYAVPINGLGAGSSTNTVRVRTNGSVPGVAEVAAFARTIAQTPVNQLRWLRPAANGILSTYTVLRGTSASSLVPIDQLTVLTDELVANYNDTKAIMPGAMYYYSVETCNGQALTCSRSLPISVTTACIPPIAPTSLQASTSTAYTVTLSWLPVTATTYGRITEYRLFHSDSGQRVSGCCDASTTTKTVEGLQPRTSYTFSVQAATCDGPGALSSNVTVATLDGPPPKPTIQDVKLTSTRPPSALITWNAADPATLQGTLLPYKVCRTPAFPSGLCKTMPRSSVLQYDDKELYGSSPPPTDCLLFDYTISAVTSFGEVKSDSISLSAPGVPPGVASVTASALSSTQLRVTWPAVIISTGCRISRYHVMREVVSQGAASQQSVCCTDARTEFIDSGLLPATRYKYMVSAETDYNVSRSVPTSAEGSTAEAMPDPPSNLRVSFMSAMLNLQWNGSSIVRGVLIGYRVSLDSALLTTQIQTSYSIPLSSLRGGWSYLLAVATENSAGVSMQMNISVVTPVKAPPPPRSVFATATGHTSMAVTWLRPMYNGNVSNYQVQVYQDSAQLITDTSVPGDQYLFNITALVNDESYYAVVTAKSTAGDSTPAQSSTERLPLRLADIVLPRSYNLSAVARTQFSLFVAWTTTNDSEVNRYTLTQTAVSGGSLGTPLDVCCSAKWKSYDATGLAGDAQYRFTLGAVLSNGTQVFNLATTEERTLPSYPGQPVGLQSSSVTATSVSLSWTPPTDANGVIIRYEVAESGNVVRQSSQASVAIDNLEAYRNYTFRVRAVNKGVRTGDLAGLYSAPLRVETSVAKPTVIPFVQADGVSKTSLFIRWAAPVAANGLLSSYRVEYSERQENGACTFALASTEAMVVDAASTIAVPNNLKIAQEYCTRVRSRNSQFDSDWSSVVTAATRSDDIVCPVVQTAPPVECPTTDGRTVDIGGNQGSLTPTSSSSTALVTVIILAIIGAVLVAILSGILYLQRSPLSKKAPGASLAVVKPRENGGDSFLGPSSMPTVGSQKTPLGYAPSASTLASLAGPTASLPREPPILEMQPMLAAADKDVDADEDYEAMPVDVRHVDPNVLSMVQNPGEATAPDPFTSSGLESKEAVADDYLEPSQMPAIGKGAPNDGGNASREDGPTAENAAETTSTGNDNVVGSAASGDGDGADQTNDGGGDYMNTVLHAAVDSSAPAATASASSLTAGGLERERVDSVLYTKPKRDRQVSVNSEMSDEARLFRPSRQDV